MEPGIWSESRGGGRKRDVFVPEESFERPRRNWKAVLARMEAWQSSEQTWQTRVHTYVHTVHYIDASIMHASIYPCADRACMRTYGVYATAKASVWFPNRRVPLTTCVLVAVPAFRASRNSQRRKHFCRVFVASARWYKIVVWLDFGNSRKEAGGIAFVYRREKEKERERGQRLIREWSLRWWLPRFSI